MCFWRAACGVALLLSLSCSQPAPLRPLGAAVAVPSPLGLPALPLPPDNPPTKATISLGEKLFSSPLLSSDGTRSCASCHNPAYGFAEAQPVSTGVGGKKGKRNAPTVLNAAFNRLQFHDGRAASLEEQASGPILNPIEMAHSAEGVVHRLSENPNWPPRFEAAFGPGPITLQKVTYAIAAFERTLISGNSAFDRYYYGGDKSALSPAAQRGLAVFQNPAKGNCSTCHSIEARHALFSDQQFHNLGAGMSPDGELMDLGRYEVTKQESDKGAFRTPTLRNIALTAPYMHDGSLKTLKEVVDFYVAGGNANPYLDTRMKALNLSKEERQDLIAFLESLTGNAQP